MQSRPDPTLGAGFAPDQVDFAHSGHLGGYTNDTPPNHEIHPHQNSQMTDWDQFDFGLGLGAGDAEQAHVDPELQALLDRILQPHLNVGIGGYDAGYPIP
jgi:hypothetical protein